MKKKDRNTLIAVLLLILLFLKDKLFGASKDEPKKPKATVMAGDLEMVGIENDQGLTEFDQKPLKPIIKDVSTVKAETVKHDVGELKPILDSVRPNILVPADFTATKQEREYCFSCDLAVNEPEPLPRKIMPHLNPENDGNGNIKGRLIGYESRLDHRM